MIPVIYNVRSLLVRRRTTAASALGIALVVFVLASVLMLSEGLKATLGRSGHPDVAVVMRKGADGELSSGIEDPQVGLVLASPQVKRDAEGRPQGVGEVVMVITIEKLGANGVSNVQVRGVTDEVLRFRPEVRVVAGRPARPGTDEAMVGTRLRGRFQGLDLGQSFSVRKGRPATVVGIFEAEGSSYESEVWVDREVLRAAFGREGAVSAVRARLTSSSALDGFRTALEGDKRLGLTAMRETEYFEKQGQQTAMFLRILAGVITFFFSLGAIIGAFITLYASVADRRREIGTLRALGFSRAGILVSFTLEGVLLALVGGGVGTLGALAMGAVKVSMINFQSFSEIVFRFTPTAGILVWALVVAGLMGLAGGLVPAVSAARTSPLKAMRD